MKVYTENELKKLVSETFAGFPKANKVFATIDGNVFLDENRAKLHAGEKGRVIPFDRPVEVAPTSGKKTGDKPNFPEIVKEIKAVASIEDLTPFKLHESNKGVAKAIADKTVELTKPKA